MLKEDQEGKVGKVTVKSQDALFSQCGKILWHFDNSDDGEWRVVHDCECGGGILAGPFSYLPVVYVFGFEVVRNSWWEKKKKTDVFQDGDDPFGQ